MSTVLPSLVTPSVRDYCVWHAAFYKYVSPAQVPLSVQLHALGCRQNIPGCVDLARTQTFLTSIAIAEMRPWEQRRPKGRVMQQALRDRRKWRKSSCELSRRSCLAIDCCPNISPLHRRRLFWCRRDGLRFSSKRVVLFWCFHLAVYCRWRAKNEAHHTSGEVRFGIVVNHRKEYTGCGTYYELPA